MVESAGNEPGRPDLGDGAAAQALAQRLNSLAANPWLRISGYGDLLELLVAYLAEQQRRIIALEQGRDAAAEWRLNMFERIERLEGRTSATEK